MYGQQREGKGEGREGEEQKSIARKYSYPATRHALVAIIATMERFPRGNRIMR